MNRYETRFTTSMDGQWDWSVWHQHRHLGSDEWPSLKRVNVGRAPTLATAISLANTAILIHAEANR